MKGVISGSKLTKAAAYPDLADFVSNRCNIHWDSKTAMSIFRAYIKVYQETKKKVEDNSGAKFTLTEADLNRKITTIKEKVEGECDFYYRLDSLFGQRQNIRPTSVLQPSTHEENHEVLKILNEDLTQEKVDGTERDEDCDELSEDISLRSISFGRFINLCPIS